MSTSPKPMNVGKVVGVVSLAVAALYLSYLLYNTYPLYEIQPMNVGATAAALVAVLVGLYFMLRPKHHIKK